MTGRVIYEIAKGSEVIRLAVDTFKGRTFASLRAWYPDGDTLKPSPKGVTIPLESLGGLHAALGAYLATNAPSGPENGS